jgi:hypothetical protein
MRIGDGTALRQPPKGTTMVHEGDKSNPLDYARGLEPTSNGAWKKSAIWSVILAGCSPLALLFFAFERNFWLATFGIFAMPVLAVLCGVSAIIGVIKSGTSAWWIAIAIFGTTVSLLWTILLIRTFWIA